MRSSRWAGRGNHILADGRRGVLQKEMAAYLCDGLGLAARPSAGNDGELRLSAAEINGWLASGKGEVAALVSQGTSSRPERSGQGQLAGDDLWRTRCGSGSRPGRSARLGQGPQLAGDRDDRWSPGGGPGQPARGGERECRPGVDLVWPGRGSRAG